MRADAYVNRVLADDALTAGLTDPEARLLIDWLTDHVERIAMSDRTEAEVADHVERLCRQIRTIRRFVSLWTHGADPGAAAQLAAAERCPWPLPSADVVDPCDVMHDILTWLAEHSLSDGPVPPAPTAVSS